MSAMILSGWIFSWKFPVINWSTWSKLFYNVISCHFEVNIVNIHFKNFMSIIIENRFLLESRWNSSLSLSLSLLIIITEISVSFKLIILIVIIKSGLFYRRLSIMLRIDRLILNWTHVIMLVMILHWWMVSLLMHSHLLHLWSTSILIHFWLVLLSSATLLSLSIMIILAHILNIPNWLLLIWHLSLIGVMLIIRLRSIEGKLSLICSLVVVHLVLND